MVDEPVYNLFRNLSRLVRYRGLIYSLVARELKARYRGSVLGFLWSFINPDHEKRMGKLIQEVLPGVPFTLSHALAPIIREYRRASATAIHASSWSPASRGSGRRRWRIVS